ncbi:DUF6531 domain-containing protein [Nonomuraea sp. JJY05]|uniref:DUF6531 domain-containing protein n=1 Tax=Nonomuraea sp. JJY05 TaxID=3350255 RepID=UPI00373F07CC
MAAHIGLFLVLMPGLAQVAALPAVADSQDTAIAVAQGTPDTPRQQIGATKNLPSLVPASVTAAPVTAKRGKQKIKSLKGAVGPDIAPRTQSTRAVSSTRLPAGTARAEALDAAAAAPVIKDMWPLDGAPSVSTTPTLVAYASEGTSPYRYEFTVCEQPKEDEGQPEGCFGRDGTPYPSVWSGALPAEVNRWQVPAGELKWATVYAWTVKVTDASGGSVTSPYRTFVTGVRQPSVGSQLANRDSNGQEFQAVSGNYTTTVVDASVATVGPALSIARTYNSLDARRDGLFGAGWSTRYDMRIQVEPSAALLVTYPDGRRLRFAPKGGGSFQAPPGMQATLAQVSGGGWKLMDQSSTVYHFNGQGRLTRIVDGRGRAQELSYNANGTLAKVTAVGGRSLTFTWSGSHIGTVSTDPVDGAPQTWTYTYDGDKLSTACNPTSAPNCTTYHYATGSLYRGLVEDDEPVGCWRLGEPSIFGPTPTPCVPPICIPQGTTQARSLGWGAGEATYSGVDLEQPGALAGSADTSASFDGDASLVELPDNAIARLDDRLSLELWFKTTTSGILAYTSAERPSSSIPAFFQEGQPLLYVGTDGKLRGQFRTFDASGSPITSPITSSGAVNNGQWHHVVLSGAANNQSLYLDGAAVGSLAGTIDHDWMAYAAIGEGATHNWPATKPPTFTPPCGGLTARSTRSPCTTGRSATPRPPNTTRPASPHRTYWTRSLCRPGGYGRKTPTTRPRTGCKATPMSTAAPGSRPSPARSTRRRASPRSP